MSCLFLSLSIKLMNIWCIYSIFIIYTFFIHLFIEFYLYSKVSSAFKRNFALLQKRRTSRHPYERVPTPYQIYSWIGPQLDHNIDAIRFGIYLSYLSILTTTRHQLRHFQISFLSTFLIYLSIIYLSIFIYLSMYPQ